MQLLTETTGRPAALPARIAAWSEQEAQRLLELSAGHELADLWRVALGTGMRRGELLGLRWQDVDLSVPQVRVSRALAHPSAGARLKAQRAAGAGRSSSMTTPRPPSTASPAARALRHEIERKGRRLRIVAVEDSSRLDRLVPHPDAVAGDPDELVSIDWSEHWRP